MQLVATLGDAPTAAIAVVAIVLGLLFAARGPRGELKRASFAGEVADPAAAPPLDMPIAEPEPEPGVVGPERTVVGHGTISFRGPLGAPPTPPPPPPPPTPPPPTPQPVAQPEPAPEPAPSAIPFRQGRIKLRDKPADEPPAGE